MDYAEKTINTAGIDTHDDIVKMLNASPDKFYPAIHTIVEKDKIRPVWINSRIVNNVGVKFKPIKTPKYTDIDSQKLIFSKIGNDGYMYLGRVNELGTTSIPRIEEFEDQFKDNAFLSSLVELDTDRSEKTFEECIQQINNELISYEQSRLDLIRSDEFNNFDKTNPYSKEIETKAYEERKRRAERFAMEKYFQENSKNVVDPRKPSVLRTLQKYENPEYLPERREYKDIGGGRRRKTKKTMKRNKKNNKKTKRTNKKTKRTNKKTKRTRRAKH